MTEEGRVKWGEWKAERTVVLKICPWTPGAYEPTVYLSHQSSMCKFKEVDF
jgi:hypothetical protein